MQVLDPFSEAREYHFPHEAGPSRQYPLYQEELLSLHRLFPEIESIGVYTGGSEVELVKALFQLNLLSKRHLPDQPDLTIEAMVRAILPGMNKPRRIEEYLRNGTSGVPILRLPPRFASRKRCATSDRPSSRRWG